MYQKKQVDWNEEITAQHLSDDTWGLPKKEQVSIRQQMQEIISGVPDWKWPDEEN